VKGSGLRNFVEQNVNKLSPTLSITMIASRLGTRASSGDKPRAEAGAAPARRACNPAPGRSGAPRFGHYDPNAAATPTAQGCRPQRPCDSASARRRNNAFGLGEGRPPARRTQRNAWTHVVPLSGRIDVARSAETPEEGDQAWKRQDAAVERREASAQRHWARNASKKVFRRAGVPARMRCGVPHRRLSALSPPRFGEDR